MKKFYMVGGPMGVGKTAACRLLKEQLPACAFLDGDWCWDMDPFVVNGETKAMVLDNICFVRMWSFAGCCISRRSGTPSFPAWTPPDGGWCGWR